MKHQYTLGPWVCIGDGFDSVAAQHCGTEGYAIGKAPSKNSEDLFESVCEISYKSGDNEALANARLIAAAPELLLALQYCLEAANAHESNVLHGGVLHEIVQKKARAAIAKAMEGV